MKKFLSQSVVAAVFAAALCTQGQPAARVASTGGKSPHETTREVIDQNRVTVTYGRPFTKDPKTGEMRKIWGGLVPFGAAWRMGADEGTTLLTQKNIMLGETEVPAGAYTLYFIPAESGASKLAISKSVGQWGVPVNEKNDLARVDVKKAALDKPVE